MDRFGLRKMSSTLLKIFQYLFTYLFLCLFIICDFDFGVLHSFIYLFFNLILNVYIRSLNGSQFPSLCVV